MNWQLSKNIFDEINKTNHLFLKNDLWETAVRYSRIRTDWYFMSVEEKLLNSDLRTRTHNALINSCNILSREMVKTGEDVSWRVLLGNERKKIGDFACYVNLILGIMVR